MLLVYVPDFEKLEKQGEKRDNLHGLSYFILTNMLYMYVTNLILQIGRLRQRTAKLPS